MFVPKLEQIAKDRYTWDFGEVLDLRHICTIEIADGEEEHGDNCYTDALVTHGWLFNRLVRGGKDEENEQ